MGVRGTANDKKNNTNKVNLVKVIYFGMRKYIKITEISLQLIYIYIYICILKK